jgi:hypothetical protein
MNARFIGHTFEQDAVFRDGFARLTMLFEILGVQLNDEGIVGSRVEKLPSIAVAEIGKHVGG